MDAHIDIEEFLYGFIHDKIKSKCKSQNAK
jgi:hypothetical protein